MSRSLLLACLFVAVPALARADEPQFEAKFADGSVVMVTVAEASVAINTKYGKLTVPLSEIKKIDLGFRYPDGMAEKVRAAMDDLGAGDYKTREEAQKKLIGYGEYAVAAVRVGLKSSVPEVAERSAQILKKLSEKVSSEKMEAREADLVVTEELTIRGTIETVAFKAKSKYFGETMVKLADLREFRPVGAKGDGRFALDASKYATQGWKAWLDTGLVVEKDTALEITAEGQIDQWSQEPGKYVSGPNGTGAQVVGPVGGEMMGGGGPPGGFQGRAGGPGGFPGGQGVYQSGAVYAKIGDKGAVFRVGANFKQVKTTAAGKLYLIIAPSNWGNESVGEYTVKVKTGG